MQLYLIRHAHALAVEEDAGRPLSAKGHAQVKQLAKFLRAKAAFAPGEIWHSPLARSRQTARLLAAALAPTAKIAEMAGLEPVNPPRTVAARLKPVRHDLAIVGHEPHLSLLAALLVTGAATPDIFKLRKAAVLCLDRDSAAAPTSRWRVRWLLGPELLAQD
ncbi:MAG: phosphohistidine phosphatase SixA [Undibacterium sp.]|nr:phosphohistidine phosphatase SixA [Opitutaceae bacterium]